MFYYKNLEPYDISYIAPFSGDSAVLMANVLRFHNHLTLGHIKVLLVKLFQLLILWTMVGHYSRDKTTKVNMNIVQ